jgi:hypothetical protein
MLDRMGRRVGGARRLLLGDEPPGESRNQHGDNEDQAAHEDIMMASEPGGVCC